APQPVPPPGHDAPAAGDTPAPKPSEGEKPAEDKKPPGDKSTTAEPEEGQEPAAPAGAPTIGRIVVDGNARVSDAAFFSNLRLKPDAPYDEEEVRREFRRMWDLDLFDDIAVESRRRPDGKVDLIFHVRDRPLLGSVVFSGMKAVTET